MCGAQRDHVALRHSTPTRRLESDKVRAGSQDSVSPTDKEDGVGAGSHLPSIASSPIPSGDCVQATGDRPTGLGGLRGRPQGTEAERKQGPVFACSGLHGAWPDPPPCPSQPGTVCTPVWSGPGARGCGRGLRSAAADAIQASPGNPVPGPPGASGGSLGRKKVGEGDLDGLGSRFPPSPPETRTRASSS